MSTIVYWLVVSVNRKALFLLATGDREKTCFSQQESTFLVDRGKLVSANGKAVFLVGRENLFQPIGKRFGWSGKSCFSQQESAFLVGQENLVSANRKALSWLIGKNLFQPIGKQLVSASRKALFLVEWGKTCFSQKQFLQGLKSFDNKTGISSRSLSKILDTGVDLNLSILMIVKKLP